MAISKSLLVSNIKTSLLIVLTFIFLFLTLTGILFLESKVQKTFLYASAMRVATEIKYLQIQAIVKGKDYLIRESDHNLKFQVIDLTTNTVIQEESAYFKNIKIYFAENVILLSGGNFKNDGKITLSRRNNQSFIYLFKDGRVVVKEE